MKKNLFFTFCFSFIPGAAQMYQTYMKRGLSIMVLFALAFALVSMIPLPLFMIPLPIIYVYSFFDTYNLRNKIGTDKQEKDEYIWKDFEISGFSEKFNKVKKNKLVGTLFILFGIYLLLDTVIGQIARFYDIYLLETIISTIMAYFVPVIIAAISIAVGIKFIARK